MRLVLTSREHQWGACISSKLKICRRVCIPSWCRNWGNRSGVIVTQQMVAGMLIRRPGANKRPPDADDLPIAPPALRLPIPRLTFLYWFHPWFLTSITARYPTKLTANLWIDTVKGIIRIPGIRCVSHLFHPSSSACMWKADDVTNSLFVCAHRELRGSLTTRYDPSVLATLFPQLTKPSDLVRRRRPYWSSFRMTLWKKTSWCVLLPMEDPSQGNCLAHRNPAPRSF